MQINATMTIGKIKTSRSRMENHDMLTACDFKCFAPFERITYSIQKIDSSIILDTKLSLNSIANSLARLKYFSFDSISFRASESESVVSCVNGNVSPFPFCWDVKAFRRWSAKNGMHNIGTPRAVAVSVTCNEKYFSEIFTLKWFLFYLHVRQIFLQEIGELARTF